ncbi:hypothetical protein [Zavarzinia sp. CC-PAN008]|uniref:hypothetical protein n=1 Tax=Zavarzinia sp. CC-PAN008 TaxID=3243332 RepID=UPI003F74405D
MAWNRVRWGLLGILVATPLMAQSGTVASLVRNVITAVNGGETRMLAQGDPIFGGDSVVSAPDGAISIAFADGSQFATARGAAVTLASAQGGGASTPLDSLETFSLSEGTFKLVIGATPVTCLANGRTYTLARSGGNEDEPVYATVLPGCVTFAAGDSELTIKTEDGREFVVPPGQSVCLGGPAAGGIGPVPASIAAEFAALDSALSGAVGTGAAGGAAAAGGAGAVGGNVPFIALGVAAAVGVGVGIGASGGSDDEQPPASPPTTTTAGPSQ